MDTGEGPTNSQKVRFFLLYFIHCRNMLNAEKVSFFNRKRGGESSPSGDMLIKISEAPDCNQSGTSFSEEIFPLYNKSPKVTLLVALRNLAPPKSTQHPRGLEVNPPPSCLFLFILVYRFTLVIPAKLSWAISGTSCSSYPKYSSIFFFHSGLSDKKYSSLWRKPLENTCLPTKPLRYS